MPLILVPPEKTLSELVALALAGRPEVAESRSLQSAASERLRQARFAPLLPRLQVDYLGGTFGGGVDAYVGHFSARGDFTARLQRILYSSATTARP